MYSRQHKCKLDNKCTKTARQILVDIAEQTITPALLMYYEDVKANICSTAIACNAIFCFSLRHIVFDNDTFIEFSTFQLFLACGLIRNAQKHMARLYIFLIFKSDLNKVIKIYFKIVVQIN